MREKLKMLPLLSDLEIEMNTYRTEIERLEELAQTSQELEDELRSQIEDYKAEIEKLSANSREVRFVSFFSLHLFSELLDEMLLICCPIR